MYPVRTDNVWIIFAALFLGFGGLIISWLVKEYINDPEMDEFLKNENVAIW